jgi:hypothetical protein
LRSKLSDDRQSCGNQTDAVNRSGINALHWELRGQTALVLILAGNHTREQQTIASRALGAIPRVRFIKFNGVMKL